MKYKSIVESLFVHAKGYPDKICLRDSTISVTFSELWNDVLKNASFLRGQGVKEYEPVILHTTQTVSHIISVLAIHLLHAIAVPVEKNIPIQRLKEIIEDTKATHVISNICRDEIDSNVIFISENYSKNQIQPLVEYSFPNQDDIGDMMFTTGTTGRAKGVLLSHKAITAVTENIIDGKQQDKDEVEIIPGPLNHGHALRRVYTAIYAGSTAIILNGMTRLKDFMEAVECYHATSMTASPAMVSYILRVLGDKLIRYANQFHYIEVGADVMTDQDKDMVRRIFPGVHLYNAYGATEAGCSCFLDMKNPVDSRCIGKATKHTRIFFVDDEWKEVNATKENPGYITAQGPLVMNGYWEAEELTKQVLENDKYYSHDLGYMDSDGFVFLIGRADDIINVSGIKVAPHDIEVAALSSDKLIECACIAYEDRILGTVPKLFVVMKQGVKFEQRSFDSFMKEQLEFSRVPKRYEVIEELPRTFNGKVDRKAL